MTQVGVWRIVQFAFTALLIALLWITADGRQILRILSQAQPVWLLAAVAVLICQTVLSALRWKLTAAHLGQTLHLCHAIREYFISQVVNQAMPGGVVGDAARAVRARAQVGLAVATQAVVFERLAGQVAMFLTMACSFVVTSLSVGGLEWPTPYAAPIGTAIATGSAVACIIAVGQWYPAILGQRLSGWIRPLYTALLSRQALPAQIGLGAVITLCNLAAFTLCAWSVGVNLSLAAILAVVPVILFSMLIPLTIGGWGIRESAAAILLPLSGISPGEGVAASVMFGTAILLAILPGLIAGVLK